MQTHTYLEESLLKIFLLIHLNLSKPLRSTLSELIACLLDMLFKIFYIQFCKHQKHQLIRIAPRPKGST